MNSHQRRIKKRKLRRPKTGIEQYIEHTWKLSENQRRLEIAAVLGLKLDENLQPIDENMQPTLEP